MDNREMIGGCECISGISCEASNCVYNEQQHCSANSIQVGPQGANSVGDTVCATFKAR